MTVILVRTLYNLLFNMKDVLPTNIHPSAKYVKNYFLFSDQRGFS